MRVAARRRAGRPLGCLTPSSSSDSPGRGKSTRGSAASRERLGRPMLDLDADIEAREGAHPATLIREQGEAAFREIEAGAWRRPARVEGAVIATGGGAVVDPLNRWRSGRPAASSGSMRPTRCSLARLAEHDEDRPMLDGDAAAALATLRAARAPFYRAADVHVDADARPRPSPTPSSPRSAGRRAADARVGAGPPTPLRRRGPPRPPHGPAPRRGSCSDATWTRPTLGRRCSTPPATGAPRGRQRPARRPRCCPTSWPPCRPGAAWPIGAGEREQAAAHRGAAARGGQRHGRRARRRLGRRRRRHHDGPRRRGSGAVPARRALRGRCPRPGWAMTDAAIGGKVGVDLSAAKNAAGAFWPPVAIVGDVAAPAHPAPRPAPGRHGRDRSRPGSSATPACGSSSRRAAAPRCATTRRPASPSSSARSGSSSASSIAIPSRPASGARSTSATPWATPWRSRAATGCRTARRSSSACARWPPSPPAAARSPDLAERIDSVVGRPRLPRSRRRFDPAVVPAAPWAATRSGAGVASAGSCPWPSGGVVEVDDVTDAELDARHRRHPRRMPGARRTAMRILLLQRPEPRPPGPAPARGLRHDDARRGRAGRARSTPPPSGTAVDAFQSNHEGALIDRLEERDYDAIVINPGALTHTSLRPPRRAHRRRAPRRGGPHQRHPLARGVAPRLGHRAGRRATASWGVAGAATSRPSTSSTRRPSAPARTRAPEDHP